MVSTPRSAVILAMASVLLIAGLPAHGATAKDGIKAHVPANIPPAGDDSTSTFGITAIRYEVGAAMVGTIFAPGADIRIDLQYPFSLGVRLSLDLDHGSLYTIPYLGVTWTGIGGFELGRMFRPALTSWTVPYWETWRVWIGDEKRLALGASVLSNVPLNSVGYWDGGITLALDDRPMLLWFGVASVGSDRRAKGPAAKASMPVGERTWLLLKASYMFGAQDDDIRTTFTAGFRQEF